MRHASTKTFTSVLILPITMTSTPTQALKIPVQSVIRMFIRNGLAQYDHRHSQLMTELAGVKDLVKKAHHMASAAVAAALLPAETGRRLLGD